MKRIITIALALSLATASTHALAASGKCKITAINNSTITLDCGSTSESFNIGDEVKIRTEKKQKKAIEGC